MGIFSRTSQKASAPAPRSKPTPNLDDTLFDMQMTAKQLSRMSRKAESSETAEKNKAKNAMTKGNLEGAHLYADNAIRYKTQALSYLKLASRIDAVVSQLNDSAKVRELSGNMVAVRAGLGQAMQSMDIDTISRTMDDFEKDVFKLGIQTQLMEESFGGSSSLAAPQREVNKLLQQIADENSLEVGAMLGNVPSTSATQTPNQTSVEDMESRFRSLQKP